MIVITIGIALGVLLGYMIREAVISQKALTRARQDLDTSIINSFSNMQDNQDDITFEEFLDDREDFFQGRNLEEGLKAVKRLRSKGMR